MEKVRLLGEWEEQEFVQLVFPHKETDWIEYLDEAIDTFINIAKTISKYQKVLVVAPKLKDIKQRLKSKNIIFVNLKSNDTWSRDFGGISVRYGKDIKILNFKFNGWGKKYPYELDNQITKKLKFKGVFKGYLHQDISFVLEGGSIDTNGNGILLTTKRCLLEKNRNPKLKQKQIEQKLKSLLGIKKILWLENGALIGDDTDSHIDTLARFVNSNTIVYQTASKDSKNYTQLKKMEKELKKFTNLENKPSNLIPLPHIEDKYFQDELLPATYVNFLIINGAVLVPMYNDKNDKKALKIFQKLFTKRDIIGIDCTTLIKQHGSLHCVTMQYPKLST